jgi:hypothetical protein
MAIANEMPPERLFPWRKELESIANWLRSIKPWQPDPKHVALLLVQHVKEVTGKQRLRTDEKTAILELLILARDAVGKERPSLSFDSFEQTLKRASSSDRQAAQDLLHSWQLLPSFTPR